MKNLFCFLAFASLLISSCSSDDSSDGSTPGVVLLKKTIETDEAGDTFTSTATYNGTKLEKIVTDGDYGVYFTYVGDLITKMEYKLGTQVFQIDTFTYNAAGDLESYVRVEPTEDFGSKEVYTHNGDGTITVTSYSGDADSQTVLGGTGTVTMTNGEVTQIVTEFGLTISYTYDTKNNPFKNVTGYGKISFVDSEASGIFHNIVTEVMGGDTHQTTYTYNANDYPATATDDYDGEEFTTEFFY